MCHTPGTHVKADGISFEMMSEKTFSPVFTLDANACVFSLVFTITVPIVDALCVYPFSRALECLRATVLQGQNKRTYATTKKKNDKNKRRNVVSHILAVLSNDCVLYLC
jgi:hypothetical protein